MVYLSGLARDFFPPLLPTCGDHEHLRPFFHHPQQHPSAHLSTTMRHIRVAEHAWNVTAGASKQQYVCRSCIAQAARQLHTTSRRDAPDDFFKRISKTIFGDKKAEEKQKRLREEAQARGDSLQKGNSTEGPSRVKFDGVPYERAARIDPATNKEYVPSATWGGLERVGGEQWVKKRLDMGEQYAG